jgi:hypothetical protein
MGLWPQHVVSKVKYIESVIEQKTSRPSALEVFFTIRDMGLVRGHPLIEHLPRRRKTVDYVMVSKKR